MLVSQNLNFDVARLGDELFDKDTVIAKAVGRLVFRGLEPFARFCVIPRDPHAFAAATSGGLDHHWISDLVRDFDRLVRVLDQAHVTRHGANASLLGDFLGCDFVTHRLDRADRWPDKGNALFFQRFGEFGVFRQKAIARMNSLGTGLADGIHHLVDHDVRLVCRRGADVDGFVCHLHMQRVAIGIRIDRDGFDTHLARSFDHTAGDFAPVGNQDLVEHIRRSFACKTAAQAHRPARRFKVSWRPEGRFGSVTNVAVAIACRANGATCGRTDDRVNAQRFCGKRASGSAGKPTFKI